MNDLQIFLPCAMGVEDYLAAELQRIVPDVQTLQKSRAGLSLRASWDDVLRINLHSRLAQRVLVQLAHRPYAQEADLYEAAAAVAWEAWFNNGQSFKIELTAHRSPLKSLNFAALKIKDAIADRFRQKTGARPDVDTQHPQVRVYAHLSESHVTLYIDTSGEPLFKRGWREDTGDAPLKESLAAAVLLACGWADAAVLGQGAESRPLYDPCCGSGTIAIEAAQMALNIAPGGQRRFGFERLLPFAPQPWQALRAQALSQVRSPQDAPPIFGSDVAFRMVDFARRNAERAGVAALVQLRGGDALQRGAPCEQSGWLVMNPPYGERIGVAGVAGRERAQIGRMAPSRMDVPRSTHADAAPPSLGANSDEFFTPLARHWKQHFGNWQAWVLSPDLQLPARMRMKEKRRVPLFNGPIECRLFGFEIRGFDAE